MTRLDPFELGLCRAWPPSTWQDITVAVAVSGGPDSVALLLGLQSIRAAGGGSLVAAHFNHATRGEQSEADQVFVGELCVRLGVHCVTGRSPQATVSADESALRDARYRFLCAAAESLAARYLATAHTADDQAETILHRVIRGTGLAGLGGIQGVRRLSAAVTLVRPMLSIRREEVLAYLGRRGQPFRQDDSNQDRQYTRNRLRHELLPAIQASYNPRVVESLLRLGQLAREAQQALAQQVVGLMDECVSRRDAQGAGIDCAPLAKRNAHVVREVFLRLWHEQGWPRQAMGYQQWDRLCQLVRGPAPGAAERHAARWGARRPARRCVVFGADRLVGPTDKQGDIRLDPEPLHALTCRRFLSWGGMP